MKTLKKIFFLSLLLPLFVACDQFNDAFNDNKPHVDYRINIATVVNADSSSLFSFRLDNKDYMKVIETNLPTYKPKDGQRIVANYTVLSDTLPGSVNRDVKLNNAYTVLTKGIFPITPATEDSIGYDLIKIENIWIGSDYLNIEFAYSGNDKTHFINLVSDASKVYPDGKIHLEFRHNANGDFPYYYKEGIVSFNLKSLQNGVTADSLNLVIHVNIANNVGKTYDLTYPFGAATPAVRTPKLTLPAQILQKVK